MTEADQIVRNVKKELANRGRPHMTGEVVSCRLSPSSSLRGAQRSFRHCEERSDEAIHSFFWRGNGLLRGACHRARIRATRWLAMTGDVAKNPIDHRCRCATLGDHLPRGAAIRHLINPPVDARI
jgi:hypothetical protein